MADRMMTVDEVQRYLDMSATDVDFLINQERLSAYKIGGEYLRFSYKQVAQLKKTLLEEKSKKRSCLIAAGNFWDFNNFYIVAGIGLLVLLYFTLW